MLKHLPKFKVTFPKSPQTDWSGRTQPCYFYRGSTCPSSFKNKSAKELSFLYFDIKGQNTEHKITLGWMVLPQYQWQYQWSSGKTKTSYEIDWSGRTPPCYFYKGSIVTNSDHNKMHWSCTSSWVGESLGNSSDNRGVLSSDPAVWVPSTQTLSEFLWIPVVAKCQGYHYTMTILWIYLNWFMSIDLLPLRLRWKKIFLGAIDILHWPFQLWKPIHTDVSICLRRCKSVLCTWIRIFLSFHWCKDLFMSKEL